MDAWATRTGTTCNLSLDGPVWRLTSQTCLPPLGHARTRTHSLTHTPSKPCQPLLCQEYFPTHQEAAIEHRRAPVVGEPSPPLLLPKGQGSRGGNGRIRSGNRRCCSRLPFYSWPSPPRTKKNKHGGSSKRRRVGSSVKAWLVSLLAKAGELVYPRCRHRGSGCATWRV